MDDATVRICLPEPLADLLDLLSEVPIVPRQALAHLPHQHVGSGPYRLVDLQEGCAAAEVFPEHWRGPSPWSGLRWQAEPDEERRVDALLAGHADLITDLSAQGQQTLARQAETEVITADSSLCAIFMCNLRSGPCANRRVRQALNHALDVPALIQEVHGGAARPLHGPLTPQHLGFDPQTPSYPHDPDLARRLLVEAGYPQGLHLTLDLPTRLPDEAPALARLIPQQWAEAGITAEIHSVEDRPAYAEMVRRKEIHDACLFDSSPLSTFRVLREKFHSGLAGPWWQGYTNPLVDRLIERAQATAALDERRSLYRQAFRLIRDDAPWLFLYSPLTMWAVGPQGQGWRPSADGVVRLP
ncbi:MAG: peptide ABC transporter substrate-binding protein [Chloroflexi bacterium]|nr:peptide ABC transporter substrate-binding protein [Chloroflexota bacterium]